MPSPYAAATRTAAANRDLRRVVASHLLAVVAEYAAVVGVLVYAFERSGARAMGFASLAILTPQLLGAPVAAALTARLRAQLVRRLGLSAQIGGYGVAAAAAAADLPIPVVVVGAIVALGAVSTLRPTGAVLLPAVVRSSEELTVGNLWFSYCESVAALVGPGVAAALLSNGGPEGVLGACAFLALAALLCSTLVTGAGPPAPSGASDTRRDRGLSGAIALVRRRPWTIGVLGVTLARYVTLGALDVLLVVLAYDELDLDRNGAGVLGALVGVGAVASAAVATFVVRRTVLAPWLAVGLGSSAALCVVLGAAPSVAVALVVLPMLGLGASLVDGLGRMLLQRSADPRQLGSLFALVELVGGIGLLLGSGLAQLLIELDSVRTALFGLAAALVVLLVTTGRAAWRADSYADVPVVEMSLLRELPMFAPASPIALETVARTAHRVLVVDGEVIVVQGELGDRFYAVAQGRFDIVMTGTQIRVAERGSFFGEVSLLADVPRTATVTALGDGELLAVDRVPFLVAVTGSDTSREAAWGVVRALDLDVELPAERG